MSDSAAAVLVDESGNVVGVVLDGSVYRLQGATKVQREVDGAFINPATQETLAAADSRLATIDSVLDAIKDTEGVKRITDALPAGTNEIGKVAQGTPAAASGAWPEYLTDGAGNAVSTMLDGSTRRLQVEAKPAVASLAASVTGFLEDSGGSADMVVDGSSTPVVYTFEADATYDIILNELLLVAVFEAFELDGASFGKGGALTNGLLIEATVNNGTTTQVGNCMVNECFLRMPTFDALLSLTENDAVRAGFHFSGEERLVAGSGDNVKVTVRDELDSATIKLAYLTTTFYGYKEM